MALCTYSVADVTARVAESYRYHLRCCLQFAPDADLDLRTLVEDCHPFPEGADENLPAYNHRGRAHDKRVRKTRGDDGESDGDHELIGHRVEKRSEIGHDLPAAREISIEKVGEGSERKQRSGNQTLVREGRRQSDGGQHRHGCHARIGQQHGHVGLFERRGRKRRHGMTKDGAPTRAATTAGTSPPQPRDAERHGRRKGGDGKHCETRGRGWRREGAGHWARDGGRCATTHRLALLGARRQTRHA
ncbi:CDP-diacylglycerol/glycerol-3-phosphate 3-phosphatidyltransferase [Gracilaria domingensis]|nr:CDP-diacylglycerol/glycerol-3-phosphate 3-phosphatidyltransferase [Gracilaria domingensis]